jgi:RNA polymerase sigma-70 factor (ECF subfamily)
MAAGREAAGTLRRLDPDRLGDHLDRLYRAAWALCGSAHDAEDLVQETYARVLARPRFLRHDDDLGYLLRVLRNVFVSQWRGRKGRPGTVPIEDEHERLADRAAAPPQRSVETREVYEAIAALPEHHRDVLVAVDVLGLSYREAAQALKVREGTIMSRLSRARDEVVRRVDG